MPKEQRRQGGPIARAIHSIDKLDADAGQLPGSPGRRGEQRVQTASGISANWTLTVPQGREWEIIVATVSNANRISRGVLIYWKDVFKTGIEPGAVTASSLSAAADSPATCLGGMFQPFLAVAGSTIRLNDGAWQAGDTDTFRIMYMEYEV